VGREVTRRYIDPLAQVWLDAARRIGLRVTRTPDTYASTDGRGTLAIAIDRDLDPDDSLAQMIFHELCHSLVEGEASFTAPDWGMDNTGPDHDWREHACLRVQWVLTGRHGLRTLFAPTTDFRAFWDELSGDVLADRTDPSVQSAIAALRRAEQPPWAPALGDALSATARIATEAARYVVAPSALELAPLWTAISPVPPLHPTGFPAGAASGTCGTCAWRYESRGRARCRQADTRNAGARIDDAWPACERYEAALDCQTCGACCRAAYHSVEVSPRDPVVKKQPQLIVKRETYLELQRTGDRCAALHGGTVEAGTTTRYHCAIYDDRPRTCRDFTLGSEHCLTARRRVGLSL
jgi:Fe-S-cluster containining protein